MAGFANNPNSSTSTGILDSPISNKPPPRLISWQSLSTFRRAANAPQSELDATESASTLFRFFRSKHVVDLKLIAVLAVVLFSAYFFAVVLIAIAKPLISFCEAPHKYGGVEGNIGHGLDILVTNVLPTIAKFLSPAIPISGAVVAWTYLSAATRLGVVDLFACEISTLCRVGTIFDVGKLYVDTYQSADEPEKKRELADHAARTHVTRPQPGSSYVSQENYFPIFESNSKDLQALEALVVGNITEYYTYMKAARDLQRKLASMAPTHVAKSDDKPPGIGPGADPWHKSLADLIYVLFLGYESGRKAINDLIEFEPTRAECTIVILLTELVCFTFLCGYLKDDLLRFKRLQLRQADYEEIVKRLTADVKNANPRNEKFWAPAKQTVPELEVRYDAAIEMLRKCAIQSPG